MLITHHISSKLLVKPYYLTCGLQNVWIVSVWAVCKQSLRTAGLVNDNDIRSSPYHGMGSLPSKLLNVTAIWLLPNYTAWW